MYISQPQILRRFQFCGVLGSGCYGEVFRVVQKAKGTHHALKRMIQPFRNLIDAKRTYREIFFLCELKHRNVVVLQEVILIEDRLYLLYELAASDLGGILAASRLHPLQVKYLGWQLLKALQYLHSKELVHRDVKPQNILVLNDCELKLCDFGLARRIAQFDNEPLTEYVASRFYRPPQLLLGQNRQTPALDIWAAGCVLAEMVLGKPLFKANSPVQQLNLICSFVGVASDSNIQRLFPESAISLLSSQPQSCKKLTQQLSARAPEELVQLIMGCLRIDPSKRLTADSLLKHSYFDQIRRLDDERTDTFSMRILPKESRARTVEDYKELIKKISGRKGETVNLYAGTLSQDRSSIEKSVDKTEREPRNEIADNKQKAVKRTLPKQKSTAKRQAERGHSKSIRSRKSLSNKGSKAKLEELEERRPRAVARPGLAKSKVQRQSGLQLRKLRPRKELG